MRVRKRSKIRITGEELEELLGLPGEVLSVRWAEEIETLYITCRGGYQVARCQYTPVTLYDEISSLLVQRGETNETCETRSNGLSTCPRRRLVDSTSE